MPQPVQNVCAGRVSSSKFALLVHEMMEQVAKLADESRSRRLVVVGAEEGGEAGVGDEPGHATGKGVVMNGDVGVEEEDERG